MTGINEGFFGREALWTVDQEDLMIEMGQTFQISRLLAPINSGLNSVETLCFSFVSLSDSRAFSRP